MLEDVADDYVSVERAARDYGVVIKVIDAEICDYAIDEAATRATRETIRGQRLGWLATDPEEVAAGYRAGKIDKLDVVRRYAVVLDWDTGSAVADIDRPVPRDVPQALRRQLGQGRQRLTASHRSTRDDLRPYAPAKDHSGRAPPWRRRKPDFRR